MNALPASPRLWWEDTPAGTRLPLAFVKLDRVGSTREWDELPDDEVLRRRARYTESVVAIAREHGAAQPLGFQGDGVMLFFTDQDLSAAAIRAFQAARALWERLRFDLKLVVRMAVHAAELPWKRDTGQLAHPALDTCGHLEHAAPANGLALTEDVYLSLPESDRRNIALLGVTVRDRTPAWVFPAAVVAQRGDAVEDDAPLRLWQAFRAYVNGPEVRRLRYVGLRLTRREPPSLDVLAAFVPLDVQRRTLGELPPEAIEAVAWKDGAVLAPLDAAGPQLEPPWARLLEALGAPEPLASVFARQRALVVLGDPGAGKTTLLRWLAVVASHGRLALAQALGSVERVLPLPVSIGRLSEVRQALGGHASVVEALARYFHDRSVADETELRAFLAERLEAGECLVLLDGLDEVASDSRATVRGWLEAFAARYPQNRYVATSRLVGFPGCDLPEGVEVLLSPFDDPQVQRFVTTFVREYSRWEGVADSAAVERAAKELLDALDRYPRLKALARNPFLLSALALIHRAEGRLPRHRVQLYEIFARALCETWGMARRIVAGDAHVDIPYEEEALPILGHLALRMQERYPTGVAPEAFVVESLAQALTAGGRATADDARRVARHFLGRAAQDVQILLERGAGAWGFLHLTFQEFFAVVGLFGGERFEDVALQHLFDPRWEELLRLGVGYMALVQKRHEAAGRLIERVLAHRETGDRAWLTDVLKKQVALAALLADEAGDTLPKRSQEAVRSAFVDWLSWAPVSACLWALPKLAGGRLHHDLVKVARAGLSSSDAETRARAHEVLASIGAGEIQELAVALHDPDRRVRWRAFLFFSKLPALRAHAESLEPYKAVRLDLALDVTKSVVGLLTAMKEGAQAGDAWKSSDLLDILNDMRRSAAIAIPSSSPQSAKDLGNAILGLNDPTAEVRFLAALSLGSFAAEEAVPALLRLLSQNPENRDDALEALWRISERLDFPPATPAAA